MLLMGCLLTILSCNSSQASPGKYIDEKKSQDFIELKSDGTFLIQQGKSSVSGKYVIDGKRVIFTLVSGEIAEGKLEGKSIITGSGDRLTKQ